MAAAQVHAGGGRGGPRPRCDAAAGASSSARSRRRCGRALYSSVGGGGSLSLSLSCRQILLHRYRCYLTSSLPPKVDVCAAACLLWAAYQRGRTPSSSCRRHVHASTCPAPPCPAASAPPAEDGPFTLLQQYALRGAACFALHAHTACLLVPEEAGQGAAGQMHVRKVSLYAPQVSEPLHPSATQTYMYIYVTSDMVQADGRPACTHMQDATHALRRSSARCDAAGASCKGSQTCTHRWVASTPSNTCGWHSSCSPLLLLPLVQAHHSIRLPGATAHVRDIQLQPHPSSPAMHPTAALTTRGSGVLLVSTQTDSVVASFATPSPAWCLAWDPAAGHEHMLFAGLQTGMIAQLDLRWPQQPVRMLQLASRVPMHSIAILPPMQMQTPMHPASGATSAAGSSSGGPQGGGLAAPLGLVASAAGAYAFWEDGTLLPLSSNPPPGRHPALPMSNCEHMAVSLKGTAPHALGSWQDHVLGRAGRQGSTTLATQCCSTAGAEQQAPVAAAAVAVDMGMDVVLSWRPSSAPPSPGSAGRALLQQMHPRACHRAGALVVRAWSDGREQRHGGSGEAAGSAAGHLWPSEQQRSASHTQAQGCAPAAAFVPAMALHGHASNLTMSRGCLVPPIQASAVQPPSGNERYQQAVSGAGGPWFCSGDEASCRPLLWCVRSGRCVQALQPHTSAVCFSAVADAAAGTGMLLGCCSSAQLKLYRGQ